MHHPIAASLLAAALALAGATDVSAKAETLDFSTITCKSFIDDVAAGSEDDAAAVMMWLDGYLSGVSGDTVLRFDAMEAFGTNLVEHCAGNGNMKLLDAARKVGLQ